MPRRNTSRIDLLLIHCEAGISPLPFSSFLPPLGLVDLASFLNAHDVRCRVIDCRDPQFSLTWLADYLVETRPRWIGVDVLTDTVFTAARLVNLVRNVSPSSRVVLGGAHATILPEKILKGLRPDAVVIGEGEIACLDLLTRKRLLDVRGIAFKRGRGIVRTPAPPLLDLDEKPAPDLSVIEGFRDIPYIPGISTGRGCPYRCAFCAAGILNPTVRWRSVDRIMEDIRTIFASREFRSRYLIIADDTFTVSPERTLEFCNGIRNLGGGKDLFWYAEGRIDRLAKDKALIPAMKAAGLCMLQLGIESGDERVLKAYRKGICVEDSVHVMEACAREGVLVHGGFITGGPFESPSTIESTRALALRLSETGQGIAQFQFGFLNPLPGTDVFDRPGEFGLKLLDPNLLSSITFDNCVTRTSDFSREDIFDARNMLRDETNAKLEEVFRAHYERRLAHLAELRQRIGPAHNSLSLLSGQSIEERKAEQINGIFEKIESSIQFISQAGDGWRDSIPVRLPFFSLDKDSRYITAERIKLEVVESEIFHYASGKLTGAEIAMILDRSEEELTQAFASLEQKKAIIYRLY